MIHGALSVLTVNLTIYQELSVLFSRAEAMK